MVGLPDVRKGRRGRERWHGLDVTNAVRETILQNRGQENTEMQDGGNLLLQDSNERK
jgi:hypothetical protein